MTTTGPAELRLNTDVVRAGMDAKGLTSLDQLADLIGLSRATVVRVMGGHLSPSPAFIAGLRIRLDIPFELALKAIEPARLKATA